MGTHGGSAAFQGRTRILGDPWLRVDLDPWIQSMVGIPTGQPMGTCGEPGLMDSPIYKSGILGTQSPRLDFTCNMVLVN